MVDGVGPLGRDDVTADGARCVGARMPHDAHARRDDTDSRTDLITHFAAGPCACGDEMAFGMPPTNTHRIHGPRKFSTMADGGPYGNGSRGYSEGSVSRREAHNPSIPPFSSRGEVQSSGFQPLDLHLLYSRIENCCGWYRLQFLA